MTPPPSVKLSLMVRTPGHFLASFSGAREGVPSFASRAKVRRHDSKLRREAKRATAWGRHGISGEEAGKIDHIEAVIQILNVGLQPHLQSLALPQIRTD